MSQVTISAADYGPYNGDQTIAEFRFYMNRQITTSEGVILEAGNPGNPDFYQTLPGSVVGGKLRVGAGALYSTTDSNVPEATGTLWAYDTDGNPIEGGPVLSSVRILDSPSTTTWAEIELYSKGRHLPASPTYWNSALITQAIAAIQNAAYRASSVIKGVVKLDVDPVDLAEPIAVGSNSPLVTAKASTSALGRTKLDVAPADANNPIAVGSNSPLVGLATTLLSGRTRLDTAPADPANPIAVGANSTVFLASSDAVVAAVKQTKYLASYANLTAAKNAIDAGGSKKELKVTSAVTLDAALNLGTLVHLSFEGDGKITVPSGMTLTVRSMDDPGSRQVFVLADATSRVLFGVGAVERMNAAWFHGPTPALCTNTINNFLASVTANGGGIIYLPGRGWTTAGNHTVIGRVLVEGDGKLSSQITITGAAAMFMCADVRDVMFSKILIDGNSVGTYAIHAQGAATLPGPLAGLRLDNVAVSGWQDGLYLHATDSMWQIASVMLTHCDFSNNSHSNIRTSTSNMGLLVEGGIQYVISGAWAIWADGIGTAKFTGVEFAGSSSDPLNPYIGNPQIEKQTVVGNITVAGNGKSVVTRAGMTGSPVTVYVPLTTADTTGALIAAKFRTALAADPTITRYFQIGGTGADVELIALDPAANVAGWNFTIEDDTSTGITDNLTSTNSVTGVSDAGMAEGVIRLNGSHAPVVFDTCQDEGFRTHTQTIGDDLGSTIRYNGGVVQAPIRLDGARTVTIACEIINKMVRDGSQSVVTYENPRVRPLWYESTGVQHTVVQQISNASGRAGGMIETFGTVGDEAFFGVPVKIAQTTSLIDVHDHALSLTSVGDDERLFIGACDEARNNTFGYTFRRAAGGGNVGRLQMSGNQALIYTGFDFNGDIRPVKLSTPPITLAPSGTIALNCLLGNVFVLTPTSNCTINATGMVSGQEITIIILTSGTSSYNVTFGTGFRSQGVLATGTVDAKYFSVPFAAPTNAVLVEKGTRGPAM